MKHLRDIQEDIFEVFEGHVKKHRAENFKEEDHDQIFSADVVMGQRAKELGLVDDVGDFDEMIKSQHPDCEVLNFSKQSKWDKI